MDIYVVSEDGASIYSASKIGLFVPDEVSPRFAALEKEDNPFVGFKNIEQISDHTLEENLGYLRKLKENYPTKCQTKFLTLCLTSCWLMTPTRK